VPLLVLELGKAVLCSKVLLQQVGLVPWVAGLQKMQLAVH
jgi:hypothetical protein